MFQTFEPHRDVKERWCDRIRYDTPGKFKATCNILARFDQTSSR